MSSRTAGIIVVGDEILKGMTKDTNSFFISQKLYSMGVKLKKISVIPDEVDIIATEVRDFSNKYSLVVTSGGVGPTHDDVTYEGVAKAFGEKLEIHQEMAKYVRRFYPDGETVSENPSLKMANLPTSAKILTKCSKNFPIIRVFNVVLFPGIPQLLERSFSKMEINDLFPNASPGSSLASAPKFHCHKLYYKNDEVYLVEKLNKAVALFGKNVNFGSYPSLGDTYLTLIAIDSSDELLAARAKMYLRSEMAHGIEVPPPTVESSSDSSWKDDVYPSVAEEVGDRVFRLLKHPDTPKSLLEPLDKAIKTVGDCFSRYDSGNGVFISFNGGKDCTALLHLIFAFYSKYFPKGNPLTALYIQTEDPFPEVEDFVHEAALRYNIQLQIRPGPLKNALQKFMDENSEMKAVLIGTRRTDPKSVSLQPFQMTDGDWPKMMRVSPLLDWSYENVWTFLRILSVPYCSLYDEGYTSIGDKRNTFPNPALKYTTEDGETKYHPAYMLEDETIERSGRQSEIFTWAAELTSNVAEVIASAFGPSGSAVLFSRNCTTSANGMSPLISRTGLQMVEILAKRKDADNVHPLLKSLVDSCRMLEVEWGDGIKSLVLITSELLRHCSNFNCDRRPGWLRRELGKALDLLGKSCDASLDSHSSTASLPGDRKLDQTKCFLPVNEEFSEPLVNSDKVMNPCSILMINHCDEVLDLLKMFFCTRFPSYVVEAVPKLLCEWIKSAEEDGRGLDFLCSSFSSLCQVKVGFPLDHSSLMDGVLLQGCGIGCMFVNRGYNFREDICRHSLHNSDVDTDKNPCGCDICNGFAKINVEVITEDELLSAFQCREDQFQFKTNCLYLTSCIPSDFIKFKISQLSNVSVIHSIPRDNLDFLRYLIQGHISLHSRDSCGFYVNWVRSWSENSSKNSNLVWLGVPSVLSLALCVPVVGMKDGLKRSCYNALTLVRQFSSHSQHRCTERIKIFPSKSEQDSCMTVRNSLKGDVGQNKEKGVLTSPPSRISLKTALCGERLFADGLPNSSVENLVAAGGLAEVYLHDIVVTSWLTPPPNHGIESIDREVAKVIALSILAVPMSLSTKGKLLRKSHQPLSLAFSSKSTDIISHRISIVQHAVSVAFSLSNISDLMLISKSVPKSTISCRNLSDSDDSD